MFELTKQVIAYLRKFNFLAIDFNSAAEQTSIQVAPTQLGKAAFASSIPAEYALEIFRDLAASRNHLVLESDLHLLYLITPHFKNLREPNWEQFIKRFQRLTKAEQDVAQFYGLDVEYLFRSSVHPPVLPAFLKEVP